MTPLGSDPAATSGAVVPPDAVVAGPAEGAAAATSEAGSPGVVVWRPADVWFPLRGSGRDVRLTAGVEGLVSGRVGGAREVLAGPGEVRAVRYFAGFGDGGEAGGLDPGLGSYVEFLDGAGASLTVLACFDWTARFPMSDPELAPSSLADVAAGRGARAVADALGADLVVSGDRPADGTPVGRVLRPGDGVRVFGNRPAVWIFVAGLVAMGVGWALSVRSESSAAVGLAAATVLFAAAVGLRCGQYLWMLRAEAPWRLGDVAAELRPAPGVPVSLRFRRRARLVSLAGSGELVFVLPGGGRRWLGGSGEPFGVAQAELVTYSTSAARGRSASARPKWAVDLRDRHGRMLARLLWDQWCAEDDGAGLRRFCSAAGIEVVERAREGRPPSSAQDRSVLGTSASTRAPGRFLRPPSSKQFNVVAFASFFAGLTAVSVPGLFDGVAEVVLLFVAVTTFAVGIGWDLVRLPFVWFVDRPWGPKTRSTTAGPR